MASKFQQASETDAVLTKHITVFRSKLNEGFEEAKAATDTEALEAALAAQDSLAAQNAISLRELEAKLKGSQSDYLNTIHAGGTLADKHLPKQLSDGYHVFDLLDPIVIDYAAKQVGRLVVEITSTTEAAIRWSISEAIVKDLHPRAAAKRIKSIIGLTERQAKAVENKRQSMLLSGVSQPAAEKASAKYSAKLLKYRSNLIANTEMANSINYGRQHAWDQLNDGGALDIIGVQREWLTSADERVCPECGPMNHQKQKLNQPFMTGSGKSVMIPGGSVHPGCRCVVVLNMKE